MRQLKLPLADIDLTWEEYSSWEKNKVELKKNEEIYTNTYKTLEMHLGLEDKFANLIDSSNLGGLKIFLGEIADNTEIPFEKKIIFFERSLEIFYSSEDIWTSYCEFAEKLYKVPSQLEKIYKRAVKNCFWNVNFGLKLLRNLEKQGTELQEIERKWLKIQTFLIF